MFFFYLKKVMETTATVCALIRNQPQTQMYKQRQSFEKQRDE